MAILPLVFRPLFPPRDEPRELLDAFLVRGFALFGAGKFSFPKYAAIRITARPGNHGRSAGREEIDPHERAVVEIERNIATLYLVFSHIVAVEVKVHRRFQLTCVRAAAGELA